MKRKKINLFQERQIIIQMIVSSKFLREIAPIVKSKYFQSPYARLVCSWILEYWYEFKDIPGKHIQDIYNRKISTIRNEDDSEVVNEFLLRLSQDYEKEASVQNIDYLIKEAITYLKLRSIDILKSDLELNLVAGDPLKAEQNIANYARIEKSNSEGVSLFKDTISVASAFLDENERLFSFPGVLGEVCGPFLRGDLVAFLGAAKKGKSWWQLAVTQFAVYYGYRIVFFSLEMPINQVVRRAWQSVVAAPRHTSEIIVPYFSELEDGKGKKKFIVKTKKEKRKGVDLDNINSKQISLRRQFRSGNIEIISLPAHSATVEDINAHLDNMYYYDNFIPDIVIVDHADIVAPSANVRTEYRHQIDDIWKKLRRMAQERHVLVVTASHAGRAAFKKDATEENIVEDIRKLAHVGKMIAINQNEEDSKINAVRIAQLAERDGRRNYRQALVLQCLEIGRPYIDSRYENEVER